MVKTTFKTVVAENWQSAIGLIIGLLLSAGLYLYQFDTVAPSIVPAELNVVTRPIGDVLAEPLVLHQQFIQKVTFALTDNMLLAVRMPGVLVGVAVTIAFFMVTRLWFTLRIAILSTVLFASSSWLLHVVRIGTADTAYLLIFILFAAAMYVKLHQRQAMSTAILAISTVSLLYVPGMIWLLLPAAIWQRKLLLDALRRLHRRHLIAVGIVALTLFMPLVYASIRSPGFLKQLAVVPESTAIIANAPSALVQVVSDIFYRREFNPLFGVASLPYLDIFTVLLIVLGIFVLAHQIQLDRTKLLISTVLLGVLASVLLEPFSTAFLLPWLYLIAAYGMALLLQQWFTVFPKNPLARYTGVILLSTAIACSMVLSMTRYFIAWPHSEAHNEVFQSAERALKTNNNTSDLLQ